MDPGAKEQRRAPLEHDNIRRPGENVDSGNLRGHVSEVSDQCGIRRNTFYDQTAYRRAYT
jgi:transcriptional regulator of acetoin/glycerol metabolism